MLGDISEHNIAWTFSSWEEHFVQKGSPGMSILLGEAVL